MVLSRIPINLEKIAKDDLDKEILRALVTAESDGIVDREQTYKIDSS